MREGNGSAFCPLRCKAIERVKSRVSTPFRGSIRKQALESRRGEDGDGWSTCRVEEEDPRFRSEALTTTREMNGLLRRTPGRGLDSGGGGCDVPIASTFVAAVWNVFSPVNPARLSVLTAIVDCDGVGERVGSCECERVSQMAYQRGGAIVETGTDTTAMAGTCVRSVRVCVRVRME
jgi:hypothetical protein